MKGMPHINLYTHFKPKNKTQPTRESIQCGNGVRNKLDNREFCHHHAICSNIRVIQDAIKFVNLACDVRTENSDQFS